MAVTLPSTQWRAMGRPPAHPRTAVAVAVPMVAPAVGHRRAAAWAARCAETVGARAWDASRTAVPARPRRCRCSSAPKPTQPPAAISYVRTFLFSLRYLAANRTGPADVSRRSFLPDRVRGCACSEFSACSASRSSRSAKRSRYRSSRFAAPWADGVVVGGVNGGAGGGLPFSK